MVLVRPTIANGAPYPRQADVLRSRLLLLILWQDGAALFGREVDGT